MKNIIRWLMGRFGYDIMKTNVPFRFKSKKPGTVDVRGYSILMPGNNPLLTTYTIYPLYNDSFHRLSGLLLAKYPSMTALDVGANVGDTIAVLKSVGDMTVIGIEGDKVSFQFLETNIRQFSKVRAINAFLSDKPATIKANLERSGWNTAIVPDETGAAVVNMETLDEIGLKNGFDNLMIKLIKIDVEGFDTIVLRGATGIMSRHKPVLFFEYNLQAMQAINEEGLPTVLALKDAGYDRVAFLDHHGRFILSTQLDNTDIISSLHRYASSDKSLLGYFDICAFHSEDSDLAAAYFKKEQDFL